MSKRKLICDISMHIVQNHFDYLLNRRVVVVAVGMKFLFKRNFVGVFESL